MKKYTEVVVVINVEIYDCGDFVIRNIGEELIKENHENINFYFIDEFGQEKNNYTILSDKNKNLNINGKLILLTEEKSESGIFLYQSKAKIKAEILKIVGKEINSSKMVIITAISPYNLSTATIANHFISLEMTKYGEKVCMLSFNIDFPFNTIGWDSGKKGLLKGMYYYCNKEDFNNSIISYNTTNQYDYIEMDIKVDEIDQITDIFINDLIKFLENQSYRYLVIDYGILYWRLKEMMDYLYYIQIERSSLDMDMDKKHIVNINKSANVDVIDLGKLDNIYSIKNGNIKFNNDREELIQWKRNLKMKLLKN